MCIVLNLYHIF